MPQTVCTQIGALAKAYPRSSDKQQGVRVEVPVSTELVIEETVVFGRNGFGQVVILGGKILSDNEFLSE